jgi:hypothetical protein
MSGLRGGLAGGTLAVVIVLLISPYMDTLPQFHQFAIGLGLGFSLSMFGTLLDK